MQRESEYAFPPPHPATTPPDQLSYGNDAWGYRLGWPCGASYVLPPPKGRASALRVDRLIGLHSHTLYGPFSEEA